MSKIVLATANPHKVEELRAILAGVELLGLGDVPGGPFAEPQEVGTSFAQNAKIKAMAYASATGHLCLADDSGLVIDALGGRPGVISSHYYNDGMDDGKGRAERDALNNARVLRELEGVGEEQRTARFVCVMALARPLYAAGLETRPPRGLPRGSGFQPDLKLSAPPEAIESDAKQPAPAWDGSFSKHSGKLPHWQVGGATFFVTFTAKTRLSDAERQIVLDAVKFWHGTRFMLHAAVVMPDHVHMLFRPLQQEDGQWPRLEGLLHSIKRHSALSINRLRGENGPLWQGEYFDRMMRTPEEAEEAQRYIEMNPVNAGLCEKPGEYSFLVRNGRGPTVGWVGLETRPPEAPLSSLAEVLATSEGAFEGRIGVPPRVPSGGNGFGYDPLFLVAPEFARTGAELSSEEKNARSHRAQAAMRMKRTLTALGLCESTGV